MTRLGLLALCFVLAAPATAQVVPDEFPSPEPYADRIQRDLVERHRGFLGGLYAESAASVGPQVSAPDVLWATRAEGGYRFRSGLALGALVQYQAPLGADPLAGQPVGAAALLGAGVSIPVLWGEASGRRESRVELGFGSSAFFADGATAFALDVTPRVVVPLTPVTSVPVGLRVQQAVGGDLPTAGPFVGITVGLRRIWADEALMVLE